MKSEYKKCLLDSTRTYMMERYCFNNSLWRGQYNVIRNLQEDTNLMIVAKSRAVGFTSLMAAMTACELALNNDEKVEVIYVGCNRMHCSLFGRQVKTYLGQFSRKLFTDEEACAVKGDSKVIQVGSARLIMVTSAIDIVDRNRNEYKTKYMIYDEPVAGRDDFDIAVDIGEYWSNRTEHIIIGGCGNHRNEKWFNFCKNNKECVIKMDFESNPLHQPLYKKSKEFLWIDVDSDDFADEFKCEIFLVKKEYL